MMTQQHQSGCAGISQQRHCGVGVCGAVLLSVLVLLAPKISRGEDTKPFAEMRQEYQAGIVPLLKRFCLDCHSAEDKEGELDLERFGALDDVRRDPPAWQSVAKMLANGEMPPEDEPQPSVDQKKQLEAWVHRYLDQEALANAGDPGPVILRRLNNSEYTYTIQDLTGVPLQPAREFPADGAAGEGFTNTGGALSMSPALVTKYLDAAKQIAQHAVLLPDGIRFSEGATRRDWTDEILDEIRSVYVRYTGRLGDANVLNRWNVSDPTKLTDEDGRVDLARYFAVLIEDRDRLTEDVSVIQAIAREQGLSPKYMGLLAEMLVKDEPSSVLLSRVRDRWRRATPDDVASIAAEIRAWQDQLWTFNAVGHFGLIRDWQEPVTPLVPAQNFREKVEPPAEAVDVTRFLVTGAAGDGQESDVVVWQRPRFERPGRKPLLLRDIRAVSAVIERLRQDTLAATSQYLAAAFVARTDETTGIDALATAHNVDPLMLEQWLALLGIRTAGELPIKESLTHRLEQVGESNLVRGWGIEGVDALSVIGNSSDETVSVPGTMQPHTVAVHPRPERWVAVGWRSPVEGSVKVTARVQDAHPQCGNGVSWSLELRHGSRRSVLREGHIGRAGTAEITLADADADADTVAIGAGDLISLVIGPRDGEHACDLTQVDLEITEAGGENREWSLAGDCADDLDAANPHADRHGHESVWHFYSDMIEIAGSESAIPDGSLLAQWAGTTDAATAAELASAIETLLTSSLPADALIPNATLRKELTSLNGPLFAPIDPAALAARATPEERQDSSYGVDPKRFGRPDASTPNNGAPVAVDDLVVRAPAVIEVRVPAELVTGAEFVTTALLQSSATGEGSVQLQIVAERPKDVQSLLPGVPVVVQPDSAAEARFRQSMDQFHDLFPLAMCYSRIVPVDVVVTLILFHREDEPLRRLMLSEEETEQLDRLWGELHYVSRHALTIVTVFEQLLEFASQDDNPARFEPLRQPIMEQAASLGQRLKETEPAHVQAVLDFATRAYRRPLTGEQADSMRQLYAELRADEVPHDEAIRLLLARVLTSPAFLYRLEQPGPGDEPSPVSDWELATRLSYFLWSTCPDDELRELASRGQLADPPTLLAQTRRMLQDPRVRRMAIEFGCQWLHIRDFDQFDEKSERHYPQFAELRGDMYEESIRFFVDLFQNDRSILELIDADHTILNERLAKLYGIPGVTGDEWRLVTGVREYARGGILAQATTMSRQAGASRTSPILRGNWISETLLGERLPRPPKDVPLLPEEETDTDGLTFRQLVEKHTSDPACRSCHRRVDPYGFALEKFDAIGRFRERDQSDRPIDTKTTVMDGTPLDGLDDLRIYLTTTRRDTVVRQFCRKLLGYALGRSVQLSDEPLLSEMRDRLQKQDFRFTAALEAIVLSRQFREIRGRDVATATANPE